MSVCNLACEGLSGASTTADLSQRKLYIGGLSPDVTSEILLNYFGRHGEIEEGSVAYDKDTNESRGFGFVTYKTVEAAKKAIDDPQKILGGRTIIVKLADSHKGKPVQTQLPAAAVVPLALPMAPVYPQPGKAHITAAPAGYTYPQTVASYQLLHTLVLLQHLHHTQLNCQVLMHHFLQRRICKESQLHPWEWVGTHIILANNNKVPGYYVHDMIYCILNQLGQSRCYTAHQNKMRSDDIGELNDSFPSFILPGRDECRTVAVSGLRVLGREN